MREFIYNLTLLVESVQPKELMALWIGLRKV